MQNLPNDIVIILGASVFLLLISLFIVLMLMAYRKRDFTHLQEKRKLEEEFNKQLLQSQMEVQENTFLHIGRELHDNVGQLLSTSRMLIGLTERSLEHPPDMLATANATLAKAINEIRSLSKSLDKEWLGQFNFSDNLMAEVNRINATNLIKATLNFNHHLNLPSEKQIILYRIVQEAMQNAIKHGHCSHITIESQRDEGKMVIIIKDDGVGFEINEINRGLGLDNMKHRVELLGGQISFNSIVGQGTTVKISLPQKTKI
ncbi:MAG: sensor histidine kinase [Chitinophagaceae bacterium]|nr:sensor histidine kinase [Chitinophagaceae bacterium]